MAGRPPTTSSHKTPFREVNSHDGLTSPRLSYSEACRRRNQHPLNVSLQSCTLTLHFLVFIFVSLNATTSAFEWHSKLCFRCVAQKEGNGRKSAKHNARSLPKERSISSRAEGNRPAEPAEIRRAYILTIDQRP